MPSSTKSKFTNNEGQVLGGKSLQELRWENYVKACAWKARSAALPAPSASSTVAAQPQPALALAAPPPPSQLPPSALAAAARVALDACEPQDDRGSKRNALARTPPRPAAPPTPT